MAGESRTERVIQDPKILAGKPVVRGTRIPVELILEHLAATPDLNDLFAAYPELTVEDVKAVLAYARRPSHLPPRCMGPRRHTDRPRASA